MTNQYELVGEFAFDGHMEWSNNPEFPYYDDCGEIGIGLVLYEGNQNLDALLCKKLGLVPNDYSYCGIDIEERLHVLQLSAAYIWNDNKKNISIFMSYGQENITDHKLKKLIAREWPITNSTEGSDGFTNFCMKLILEEDDTN